MRRQYENIDVNPITWVMYWTNPKSGEVISVPDDLLCERNEEVAVLKTMVRHIERMNKTK